MIKSEEQALTAIREYLSNDVDDKESLERLEHALRHRTLQSHRLSTLARIKRDRILDSAQVRQALEQLIGSC